MFYAALSHIPTSCNNPSCMMNDEDDDMEGLPELRPLVGGHGTMGVAALMAASNDIFRKLSEEDLSTVVDLQPYCNTSPYTVPFNLSLSKTYTLFRSMGLRHLCGTQFEIH